MHLKRLTENSSNERLNNITSSMRKDVQTVREFVDQLKEEIEEKMEEKEKRNHDSSIDMEKKLLEKISEVEKRALESSFNQIQDLDERLSSSIDDFKENIGDMANEIEKDAEEQTKLITNLG